VLRNPFTPSDIAATPDQFFGRERELQSIEASLPVGSVLIQGPIGIGKSSLLARALDMVAADACDTRIVVADREVQTGEAAARLVLDSLVDLQDEPRGAFRMKLGLKFLPGVEPNIEVESKAAAKDQREGRYLAALKKILEADYKRRQAAARRLLVIGIDEADKAAAPIARLLRSVWTHCQQVGVPDVRFVIAGVSPLHQDMLREDFGIERAFNRAVTLAPMRDTDTHELLVAKFTSVLSDAQRRDIPLRLDPEVIDRIAEVSGGHPHIVQLLGSHIIQRENEQPDGVLSLTDLIGALHRVCYDDRRATYAATLHMMENAGKLPAFTTLLGYGLLEEGFPTRIFRQGAAEAVGAADLQWFVEHDILVPRSADEYGLVDEFLRIRLAFDAEQAERRAEVEAELVQQGRLLSWDEIQEYIEGDEEGDAEE
jgi:hypothetical protein